MRVVTTDGKSDTVTVEMNGEVIDAPEQVGEMVYYGPNVTLGYAEQGEDLIKGDERGGVLKVGDGREPVDGAGKVHDLRYLGVNFRIIRK